MYGGGCIPKLLLVRAIMKVGRNTVDGVKFILPRWRVQSFFVVWYYDCHQLVREIKKG